MKFKKIFSQRP